METRLTRQPAWNPFFLNGYEINRIKFYKDGEVLASTDWFENNNPYKWVALPFEVKNARKINLTRTDAYLIRNDKSYSIGKQYDLYICADLVELEYIHTSRHEVLMQIETHEQYSVKLHGCKRIYKGGGPYLPKYEYIEDDYIQKFDCNYTFVDTEKKQLCEQLAEEFNTLIGYKNFSCYDVEKLIDNYEITKKKNN